MRKLGIIFSALAFLIFTCGSSFAANQPVQTKQPQIILDQLLTGPIPELNAKDLNIPADLSPGFHELTVEVYDKKGVISTKTALFCKDLQGQLHFDNVCPDLTPKPLPPKPARFNPYENPEKTISFFAIVFAVGGALVGSRRRKSESEADLGGVDSGSLGMPDNVKGWGDRRWYIHTKLFTSLDALPKAIVKSVERFSSLGARAISDARYLRAIFGNFAWLTIPLALYFSYLGMRSIKNHALPFERNILLILVLLGVFDAFAGICAAFVYLDFTFASGNLNSQNAIFFTLGFTLLFFAPALVASKFRPLHRKVRDFSGLWERMTDYVLASILTGWVGSKLILALSGLIGYKIKLSDSANMIGVYIGFALFIRLLLEEIAWYLYPYRIYLLHIELREPGILLRLRAIIFKVGILIILAQPYIGWNTYLAIGISIFLFPQLLGLVGNKLPKFRLFGQLTPSGALKIVWLGIVGILVGTQILNRNLGSKESVLLSFVILPIPSFIYSVLDLFSKSPYFDIKHPKFRYIYRILSLLVLLVLVLQILGLNPVTEVLNAWHHPRETWNSLTYKWWPYVQVTWKDFCHWLVVAWKDISDWTRMLWRDISLWAIKTWDKAKVFWSPNY